MEIDPSVEDISYEQIAAWDSFNKLRLVEELEQVFGIQLDDREVLELASLRQAEELLRKRGVTQPATATGHDNPA